MSITHTETVTVTPQLAEEYLRQNGNNPRKLNQKLINRYARSMKRGEWTYVGDPIRFDLGGNLIDGQHRLHAIILSGTTQDLLVITGLPVGSGLYIDQGRSRSDADHVRLEFPGIKNAPVVAAAVRLLIRWEVGDATSRVLTPEAPEVLAYVREHRDELAEAGSVGSRVRTALGAGTSSVPAAVFARTLRMNPVDANEFAQGLVTGGGLPSGSPVLALRNGIMGRAKRDRWTQAEELYFYVKVWNYMRRGRALTKLQLPKGGLLEETSYDLK